MNKISSNNLKQLNKSVPKKLIPLFLSSFIFISCTSPGGPYTGPATSPSSSGIPADLQQQLDKTTTSNTTSASNALVQAKIIYGDLVGRWNTISPIDVQAFTDASDKLLPVMFIVANSLTSDTTVSTDKQSIQSDFKDLYNNSLTNMLRGINNNLLIYQSSLENSQIGNSAAPDNPFSNTDEAITTLSNIFVATESTELFVAQLGQFTTISADETTKVMDGLKNQQTTIINGIINFTSNNVISQAQAKTAYQIIVKSLTSTNLLSLLSNLAITVFGKDNVAFKQDELTSAQPSPNLVLMVIREDNSTYRMISVENNKVVNRVSNDTRGLSASDLLNQSNVNVVTVK